MRRFNNSRFVVLQLTLIVDIDCCSVVLYVVSLPSSLSFPPLLFLHSVDAKGTDTEGKPPRNIDEDDGCPSPVKRQRGPP